MKKILTIIFLISWIKVLSQDTIPNLDKTFPMGDKWDLYNVKPSEKNPYRLDQTFYFNKKIYFTAKSPEVQLSSYFYLNTKTGATGYDIDIAKQLGKDYSTMDFLIKLDDGNNFLYSFHPKTNEKIARILREGMGFLPQYLKDANSVEFFKDYFEKTDSKTTVGDKSQYNSILHQSVNMDGGSMFVLISDNSDFNLNPDNKLLILGYFGIGYIFIEGSTKLITGWESDSYISRLEYIEDTNFTFDGKPYKTYQEKANEELVKFNTNSKVGFEKEKEQQDARERQLNSRMPSSEPQRDRLDREILDIKKQITSKKESLTSKASSKAKEVSKKQGDIDSMNKNMYETMGSNDILEIFQLEFKLEELKASKKLLAPGLKEKDRTNAQIQLNCAKKRQTLINRILGEYKSIDDKYPENEQQRFIQKMNLMNTQLMPVLQEPCK